MYCHQNPQWYQQQFPQRHEPQQTSLLNKVRNCLRLFLQLVLDSFFCFVFVFVGVDVVVFFFPPLNFVVVYKLAKTKKKKQINFQHLAIHDLTLTNNYRLYHLILFYKTNNLFTDGNSGKSA